MKKCFAVLVLAALLATGAQAAPVPPNTVVKAPDWSAGSEWHYSDGYAVKVNSVSAKGAMFERLDAPGQWFMRQGFIKTDSTSGTATRNAIYRTVPDTAGLSLSAAKPLTFQREYLNNGKLLVHASSWTVEGRETITVPAGSFDCWVIVWRTRSMKSDWTGFERWWYSPQVQNYVRLEYKYGPDEGGSRVLMTYDLAGSQPAPVAAPLVPVAPQALPAPIPSATPAPALPLKPAPTVVAAAPAPVKPEPVKEAPVRQSNAAAPAKEIASAPPDPAREEIAIPVPVAQMVAAPAVKPSVKTESVVALAPVLPEEPLLVTQRLVAASAIKATVKTESVAALAPVLPEEPLLVTPRLVAASAIKPSVKAESAVALAPVLPEEPLHVTQKPVAAPAVTPSFKDVAALEPVLAEDLLPVLAESGAPSAPSEIAELTKIEITPARNIPVAPIESSDEDVTVRALAAAKIEPQDDSLPASDASVDSEPASPETKLEHLKIAQAKPAKPRPPALPKGDKSGPWHAQLGASLDAANVRTSLKKILARNPGAHELPSGVTVREVEGRTFYRAWLGSYDSAPEARSLCEALNIKKVRISGCTIFKGPTTMEARAN